jgi:PD-(D/E)XK nuclease superfamily
MFRLAQGQLDLLAYCPRKFQHMVLDQIGTPISPEYQARIEWGNRFHLLMQQRELGLIGDGSDDPLVQCVHALVNAAPELFVPVLFRQSEHRRILEFCGWTIATVYDLLILNPNQAQIIDWKTYPQPQDTRRLAQNWQTRLYPFVLAETTDYEPEQISMTYWFVQPDAAPQRWTLPYTAAQHHQTQKDLSEMLAQLTTWMQDYEAETSLPQVDERYCASCPFAVRCQRLEVEEAVAITDIAEVIL